MTNFYSKSSKQFSVEAKDIITTGSAALETNVGQPDKADDMMKITTESDFERDEEKDVMGSDESLKTETD